MDGGKDRALIFWFLLKFGHDIQLFFLAGQRLIKVLSRFCFSPRQKSVTNSDRASDSDESR